MDSPSPTARRFIAQALSEAGDHRRQADWRGWADGPSCDLPPKLARVALQALAGMARRIEDRIDDQALDSAEAARLENDLGYIADVEAMLSERLRQPVYA